MPLAWASQDYCSQCPWPHGRSLSTHASARDSQTHTGKSGSISCGVTAPFSLVLVHTRFCLCPPGVSVSSVLWKFCNQILLSFKARFPGDTQYICLIPRLWSLLGLEHSQQCENFYGIIVLQFVSHLAGSSIGQLIAVFSKRTYATLWLPGLLLPEPHGRPLLTHASAEDPQTLKDRSGSVSGGGHCTFPLVLLCRRFCLCPSGISAIVPFLSSYWGFSFALGYGVYFFSRFQYFPVNGCSVVSCNFGVFEAEGEHMSFYSTILELKVHNSKHSHFWAMNV